MKYHNITKDDMLNGEGLRVVLWVSGCSHKCPACQNVKTWDSTVGLEFDSEAIDEIFMELSNDWCSGLTLSGGDPLYKDNRGVILDLVKSVKKKFPMKSIWLYTGYLYEEIIKDKVMFEIINYVDVLLDGKFLLRYADIDLEYVGSSNQCVIDVKKSLEMGNKILYIENKKEIGV